MASVLPRSRTQDSKSSALPGVFNWKGVRGPSRKLSLRSLVLLIATLWLFWIWLKGHRYRSTGSRGEAVRRPSHLVEPMVVPGFLHPGPKDTLMPCDAMLTEGEVRIQPSFEVHDDMYAIVDSLRNHPIVEEHYKGAKQEITPATVDKTWLRMAQSSVWLEQYQVYLTVTRIVFYTTGVRHWSKMSFLRGQIHDEDWKELKDYAISFKGNTVTFPRIFDIPSPYTLDRGFYGPEDPRIIIEEGVEDAEPVIVFNMLSGTEKEMRSMYVHRPFTNDTQILMINGRERRGSEKNWAPFFYSLESEAKRWPNAYIHFIYEFKPLQVLRCHLLNGWCDFVYQEAIPDSLKARHNDTSGNMRGGTNFVPITTNLGQKQSFLGFPRTHIDPGCKDGFYRPALAVLTATSSSSFHYDFMSDSLDFNQEPLPASSVDQPCKDGRVLIANSVADWKGRSTKEDTMTLTFSVDDYTTQVLRLQGVQSFLDGLATISNSADTEHAALMWAVPSQSILGCSVEAATNWTIARVAEGKPNSSGGRTG